MPKKLIEVAIPLARINEAAFEEKKLRSGMPSSIHAWWARRPLAASRAVIFAQLVDDPSEHRDQFRSDSDVEKERTRLFGIIEDLIDPKGPSDENVARARNEILQYVPATTVITDPFAGGGSIPLEALRLGLNVDASDLNPVAVLLNEALLSDLQEVAGTPRMSESLELLKEQVGGSRLSGLAADIQHYGHWVIDVARQRLNGNYAQVHTTDGRKLEPLAWIWARTVPCENPGCLRPAPLIANMWLSKKKGRQCWLEPVVGEPGTQIEFRIRSGSSGPKTTGSKTGRGVNFVCMACGSVISEAHIRASGQSGSMSHQLLAVVALGNKRREYFEASFDRSTYPVDADIDDDCLDVDLPHNPRAVAPPGYGMSTHRSMYTPRQRQALVVLADLISEVKQKILHEGASETYASVIQVFLGLALSKLADLNNTFCWWEPPSECPRNMFKQQAIPMMWDFVEANPLGEAAGSFSVVLETVCRGLVGPLVDFERIGSVRVAQQDATTRPYSEGTIVCMDPPYFDNIGYADVADFFYVWLRRCLKDTRGHLFGSLLTPKEDELVVTAYRASGGRAESVQHFEDGFRELFSKLSLSHDSETPMTVFYAYKQEDHEAGHSADGSGAGATGWEKLLQGMIDNGLQITATWPMRTEMGSRLVGRGTNALASSIVLACRKRPADAGLTDRQGFIRSLRRELSDRLVALQSGGIQPVDLAQASIGPGMAVFTSYAKVLEGGDKEMSVGTALQIINQVLDELQTDQEAEFDSDTRWAVTWFDQHGMNAADFGDAQNIATARGTAVNALERAGIVEARAGRVRLLTRDEYADDWDPTTDKRLTVWEVCQHLIRRVEGDGGLTSAAALLRQVGGLGEAARDLAYRLYEIANRNGWSEEARAYNNLAAEWPDLVALAAQAPSDPTSLF